MPCHSQGSADGWWALTPAMNVTRMGRVGSAGASGSAPFFAESPSWRFWNPQQSVTTRDWGIGGRGEWLPRRWRRISWPQQPAPMLASHGSWHTEARLFNLDSGHQREAAHWSMAGRCPLAWVRIQPHLASGSSHIQLAHAPTHAVGAVWMPARLGPTFVLRATNGRGLRGPARCAENVSTMTYSRQTRASGESAILRIVSHQHWGWWPNADC